MPLFWWFPLLLIWSGSWAQADELELIFYRAPKPLNWTSPGVLVRGALDNMKHKVSGEDYPHSISHVNIKLQCGQEEALYRGMTSDKSNASYAWDFFLKRISMDVLMINVPGRFYTKKEILHWLPRLKRKGYVRSLKIAINPEQCARAKGYLSLYEKLRLQKIYGGLRSDPLRGEGAGCSAFAVSFLQVLGLFPEEIDQAWRRELKISEELITTSSRKATIGVLGFGQGKNRPWVRSRERYVTLSFWDPELMFKWAGDMARSGRLPSKSEGPFISVQWDARGQAMASGPVFPWSEKIMEWTVGYHRKNTSRLLTLREARNQDPGRCRLFQPCY
ncbi:hypothetical protein D3C87_145360 [compost metagenome]